MPKKAVLVGGDAKSYARDVAKLIQDPDLTINVKAWPESSTIRTTIVAVVRAYIVR